MNKDQQDNQAVSKKEKKKKPVKDKKKSELEELKEKRDEYLAGWQRARADYLNLQKQTTKKVADTIKHANEALLLEMFPMVDHFKYAFKGIPEEERESNWLVGIEHIQSNFIRILEEHNVEVIATEGEQFDPELHEAVEEVDGDEGNSGVVAEEVATGFRLNGKVIQPAKVKVYK